MPIYNGETWGELAVYTRQLQAVVRGCDADKAALREWADE